MFTVDKDSNQYFSDSFVQYRTLRFNGIVKGQLVDRNGSADAICRMLNEGIVAGTNAAEIFAV